MVSMSDVERVRITHQKGLEAVRKSCRPALSCRHKTWTLACSLQFPRYAAAINFSATCRLPAPRASTSCETCHLVFGPVIPDKYITRSRQTCRRELPKF